MAIPSSSTHPSRSAASSSYPTKKPPAPPEFLEAARAAALRSGAGENRIVLDCYLQVNDERSIGGILQEDGERTGGKPVRDVRCGFKNAEKQFVNFFLTLWEELALNTGPVLKESVDRQWSQVEVDLKSAFLKEWTSKKDGSVHKDVQIGKAWILLPAPDGRWAPVHEPLPEPVEEEYSADDIDDGVDPFLPEFDEDFLPDGKIVGAGEGGEEEEVNPNDL